MARNGSVGDLNICNW